MSFFIDSLIAKKRSLLIFEIQFPMFLFLHLFKTTRDEKWPLKIKWITLDLLMKKLFQEDEDYDDYNTPNTSRVDETSFTGPDATDATSNLQLKTKGKTR